MIYAFLFGAVLTLGVVCLVAMWRSDVPVIPRQDPRYIFRVVRREDRAAYRRIMRRTLAVQYRDMGRAANRAAREIGKALIPTLERLAADMDRLLGRSGH